MRKGIALFLVIVLVALLLPTPAYGVATSAEAICEQIRTTYRKAFQLNNYKSFNGWCATLVNWQTYLLGIDTVKYGCDGKNEFDLYSKMQMTTGGYRVKSYPASAYTLRQAFDAITCNGTVDVYNLLVGFERTNTTAGRIYGHAVFIHAIIDNTVYFVECFDSGIDGRYWAEGSAIACSVEEFCRYYNTWTVFDGIAYFGLKTYADLCQHYTTNMDAMTLVQSNVMYEPVDTGVNDEDPQVNGVVAKGEVVRVTDLLKTPGGSYWYAVESAGLRGFVPAGNLLSLGGGSTATVENMKVPTALHTGHGFILGGVVAAQNGSLQNVTVDVYSGQGENKTLHFTASVENAGSRFSLNTPAIDNKMAFRTLPVGTYRLAVSATVAGYVYEGGQMIIQEETVELWNSEFRVVDNWDKHHTVTFDPNGGSCDTDKVAVAPGGILGALPVPQKAGHTFLGWYTQAGEIVKEEMPVTGDMTVVAGWLADGGRYTGWLQTENGWTYLENGSVITGWFTVDGVRFYRYSDGSAPTGWTELDGKTYYFSTLGAAQTGWLIQDGIRYYLQEDGVMATGWLQIEQGKYWFDTNGVSCSGWLRLDGVAYYLDENGACLVGEHELDGKIYTFREDGSMVTGWVQRGGKTLYLDENGKALTGWQNIDGAACYFGSDGGLYVMADSSCNYGCLLNTSCTPKQ